MTPAVSEQIKKDEHFWRSAKAKDVLKYFVEGKDISEIVKTMKTNHAYVIRIARHPSFLRKMSDFILATQMHKAVVQSKEILILERTLETDLKLMKPEDRIKELNKLLADKSFEKLSEPLINLFIKFGEAKRLKDEDSEKPEAEAENIFKFDEVPISDEEHKQITTEGNSGMADGESDQNEQGTSS